MSGAGETTTGSAHDIFDADQDPDKMLAKARNTAYRYLSIRPRSRLELERKLGDKQFPDDLIRQVMAHLDRLGYVNDRDFAGQWARSRVRLRGLGRRRIEQELREKGIDRATIGETLAGLFEDSPELDLARKEAQKKLRTLQRFAPDVRQRRLAGFLERKGYPSNIIRTVLKEPGAG